MGAQHLGFPNGVTFFGNLSAHYIDRDGRTQRRHGRVAFHIPVRLQSEEGTVEFAVTENLSKGGFRFSSFHNYLPGQALLVEIHCNDGGQALQARGRIVDRREKQNGLISYGIQYSE
jgi:PilZ domain